MTPHPRRPGAILAIVAALAAAASCSSGSDKGATDSLGRATTTARAGASTTGTGDSTASTTTTAGTGKGATDGASIGRELTATLATALGGGFALAPDEATCAGKALVESLTAAPAQKVARADPAGLSGADKSAVSGALDSCAKSDTLATAITTAFYSGLGTAAPPPAVSSCVAGKISGRAGETVFVLVAASADGSTPKALVATFDACVPPDEVAPVLAAQFEASGMSADAAKCAADRLKGKITIATLAEISGDNGNIPVDVQAAINDAKLACAPTG